MTTRDNRVENQDAPQGARGTHQNIARAVLALDVLAKAGAKGLRFADVVRVTGLNKTVVHRSLAGLIAHGLATFDQDVGRFFLGDRIFAWTVTAGKRYELAERVRPFLNRLAEETEDTAYFMLRRGDHAICYGRAVGSFPVKTLTVNIADQRPLGIGAGPLAILAALDDQEIERLIKVHEAQRALFGLSDESLRQMIATARTLGYSFNDGHFIQGMRGVGVPVRNVGGEPVASLSIAAISSRLGKERREQLVASLRATALLLQEQFPQLLDHPGRIEGSDSPGDSEASHGFSPGPDEPHR